MATTSDTLNLKKPSSIWGRKVKIDAKPLLKSIGKAATHIATLKLEELGNDSIEAATSIGIDTPAQEIAFTLIYNSLQNSLLSLTKESFAHLDSDKISENLSHEVELQLTKTSITFNKDFFLRPSQQPFITEIVKAYSQWLCDSGVSPQGANSISKRLPAYFTYALSSEWRKNVSIYRRLIEQEDSPFENAEAALHGWGHYFNFLRRRISENVFDETFSLDQIYIPLNGYFILKQDRSTGHKPSFAPSETKVCVELENEIKRWIASGDKADPLRVLSGGPGSGKSSFTRVLCCKLAEAGLAKPIYVPLHLIDPTRDVANEVERFIRDEGLLGFNPLDPDRKESGILLVFDGLDELASLGKAAAQVARDFIQAVEKMLERRNLGEYPIFSIISGRELIVQENETEFRRPRQVLTILPYVVHHDRHTFSDPSKLIGKDLRKDWWRKFGELTGTGFDGIPAELRISEIDDITAQPLLNYLVALSYRRGKLQFSRKLNLNSVYADLVSAVHERAYEKSKTYGPISHISQRDFLRVLEEIGLAAWHSSDGRSSSVKEILNHCQQSGLQNLFRSFTEGAEAGVTKLLAAFFFRRSGEAVGDDAAFVFTHKSFGEYLTATRLIRAIERVVLERERRIANPDDGFDIGDALTYWTRTTGPAPMTEYIQRFLIRELDQREEDELKNFKSIFTELASTAIESGIPMERIGNLAFSAAKQHETNSAVSILVALNGMARALQATIKLNFASATSFGTFLRRHCPQRSGPQSPLLFSALSYLDLSGQCLDMAEFYGADLSHTIWRDSKAHFANFANANLDGANFRGAMLSWCRLDGARLSNTSFRETILESARFGHELGDATELDGVDFQESDLRNASFVRTKISYCDFRGAKVSRSTLNKAIIEEHCKIEGIIISETEKSLLQWCKRVNASGVATGLPNIVPSESIDVFRDA